MEKEILIRFIQCRTTREEELQVLDWLDESPEHRKELDELDMVFSAVLLNAPSGRKASRSSGIKRNQFRHYVGYAVGIAAALLIAFIAGYTFSPSSTDSYSNETVTLNAPIGQMVNITLQDGTDVCLSGGSSMTYQMTFGGCGREVFLSGEAMFDVASDSDRSPFTVRTFAGNIKVLGTKFDVIADEASDMFSTALLRGKVQVTNASEADDVVVLEPGQKVRMVAGSLEVSEIESANDYLWTDNIIVLEDESFDRLLYRLEKSFGRKIIIVGNPPYISTRGKINVTDGIEHALKIILDGSGKTFEIERQTGTVYIR